MGLNIIVETQCVVMGECVSHTDLITFCCGFFLIVHPFMLSLEMSDEPFFHFIIFLVVPSLMRMMFMPLSMLLHLFPSRP